LGIMTRADGQMPIEPYICHETQRLSAYHSENLPPGWTIDGSDTGQLQMRAQSYENTCLQLPIH
jgi:hypothetical protein